MMNNSPQTEIQPQPLLTESKLTPINELVALGIGWCPVVAPSISEKPLETICIWNGLASDSSAARTIVFQSSFSVNQGNILDTTQECIRAVLNDPTFDITAVDAKKIGLIISGQRLDARNVYESVEDLKAAIASAGEFEFFRLDYEINPGEMIGLTFVNHEIQLSEGTGFENSIMTTPPLIHSESTAEWIIKRNFELFKHAKTTEDCAKLVAELLPSLNVPYVEASAE